MVSPYSDLQQAVREIAEHIAEMRNGAATQQDLRDYAELHDRLIDSAQKLFSDQDYLQAQASPDAIDAALDHAARTREVIVRRLGIGALSLGVDELVSSITALPGKSTTGGGGPISG
jgi:hypothetical protein